MNARLDLESFARVQARLRQPFAEREEVLRTAGLDETSLRAAQAVWSGRLKAADAGPLRDRYRAAFAGTDIPGTEARPASLSTEPAAPSDRAPESEEDSLAGPGGRYTPSYLLAPPPREAPSAQSAPPQHVPPPASVVAAPPRAVVDLDATQPPFRREGATLPFARDQDVPDAVRAAWAEQKAVWGENRGRSAVGIDETAFLPRSAFTAPAVPFETPDVAGSPTTPSGTLLAKEEAKLVVPVSNPDQVARARPAPQGTMAMSVSDLSPATPFVAEAGRPAEQRWPVGAPSSRPMATPAEKRAALTGTALVDDATPAATPVPEGAPAMTVEQYAWLSATLKATPPSKLVEVLARVRLTEASRRLLEAHWNDRFVKEPGLRQAFMHLFAKHLAKP